MTSRPSLPGVLMSPRSTSARPAQQPWLSKLHAPCKCASGNAWRNVNHVCGCDGKGSSAVGKSSCAGTCGGSSRASKCGGGSASRSSASTRGGVLSRMHAMHVAGASVPSGIPATARIQRSSSFAGSSRMLGGSGGGLHSATGGSGDPTRGLGPPGSPCCCDPPASKVPGSSITPGYRGNLTPDLPRIPGTVTPPSYYRCVTKDGRRVCTNCGSVRTAACSITWSECVASCEGPRGLYGEGGGATIRSAGGPCPEESTPYPMWSGCSCPGVLNASLKCHCRSPRIQNGCCCCPKSLSALLGPQPGIDLSTILTRVKGRTHKLPKNCWHVKFIYEMVGSNHDVWVPKCRIWLDELYVHHVLEYPPPGRNQLGQPVTQPTPYGYHSFVHGRWNRAGDNHPEISALNDEMSTKQDGLQCPGGRGESHATDCPVEAVWRTRRGILMQRWRIASGCKQDPKLREQCPSLCLFLLYDFTGGSVLGKVVTTADCEDRAPDLPGGRKALVADVESAYRYFDLLSVGVTMFL
jgi:hypothetical protein